MTNMTGIPRVSIIIPVYNTAKYLPMCLESVLGQTLKEIEVITVDDGSTDHSLEILRQFQQLDPRIHVFQNHANRGVSYTLNQALKHSTASLVARVDSDDISALNRMEKQSVYLREHPDCVAVGGQLGYIDENGAIIDGANFPLSNRSIRDDFFYYQPIADPSVMFNRERIPEPVFRFDESLVVAEGLDLYFRLFPYGQFANLPDTLVYLRQRDGSLTRNLKRTFAFILRVRLRAVQKYHVKAPFMAFIVNFLQKMIITVFPISIVGRLYDLVKQNYVKYKG